MVTRFGNEPGRTSLSDLEYIFPKDVYPVGRLDADSEGLLLLTNDKKLNNLLLNPRFGHQRTYLAQVEGTINEEALQKLRTGVELRIEGKTFITGKARAEKTVPDMLPERFPPVRFRKTVPDSWLKLSISEGKNRQVRRMCAAVGFPVLRLIRISIGEIFLPEMIPGKVWELNDKNVYALLGL